MTSSNPFAPPKAPVELSQASADPSDGRCIEPVPWWVVRRNFDTDSGAAVERLHPNADWRHFIPEGTALWAALGLYVALLAGLRGSELLDAWPGVKLPIAGLKLFFPTKGIEILLLAAIAATGIRHGWLRHRAIQANPDLLRSVLNLSQSRLLLLEQVELGWSIVWRLQALAVVLTYASLYTRDVRAMGLTQMAGRIALIPLSVLFMRQIVRRLYGDSTSISTWLFLGRCGAVIATASALEFAYQMLVLKSRGTLDLYLIEWGVLLSALTAIKCLGFGWATLRAIANCQVDSKLHGPAEVQSGRIG